MISCLALGVKGEAASTGLRSSRAAAGVGGTGAL